VQAALILLAVLVGTAPAALFFDGSLTLAFWSALLAVALIIVARSIRPGEGAFLVQVLRPLALFAVVPAVIIVIQVLPMPAFLRLANPIWESAAVGLDQPLFGSISVDPGATVLSLCRYLAFIGIIILAAATTIDRRRAETALFVMISSSVVIALLLVINDALGLLWLDVDRDAGTRGAAIDVAILGVILAIAAATRAYERFETHRSERGQSARLRRNLLGCAASLIVCTLAVFSGDRGNALFAAGTGVVMMLAVTLIRRVGAGLGSALAVAATGCLLIIAVVAQKGNDSRFDFTLRFAANSGSPSTIAQRILSDVPWAGSGAGGYRDLVPIYRGPNEVTLNSESPTSAAQLAVEFGRPIFWIGVLAIVLVIVRLLQSALTRGRDSFYSAAGAAGLLALLIAAFGNSGLPESAVIINLGTLLGLAIAQSQSRAT
jgi:hypothetical protein